MIEEDIDLVAGDSYGARWRRKMGPDQQHDSTPEEAFKNARLLVPPGPTPLFGGLGAFMDRRMWLCQTPRTHKNSG